MEIILSRLLVTRFYKMNAGFFIFLFIMLFGILPGADSIHLHHAIMDAVTGSWVFTLVAAAVFLLYNFKCVSFSLKEIDLPENSFIFNIQGESNLRQYLALGASHVSIYFPALIYGTITVGVGISNHHYALALAMLGWQGVMCATGTWAYFNRLNSTWKKPLITLPSLVIFPKKSFLFYLLHYSVYNRKGTFIAIKIFSLLLLQFLVVLNAGKESKENVCFLVLFCISAHALLPVYFVRFLETELSFLRNLPISMARRISVYAFTYLIIFIPEILFLLWNESGVLSPGIVFSIYALAVSRLTLYTSLQYLKKMGIDRYTTVVLVLFFVTLILLASLNLWLFAIGESIVACTLFSMLYFKFEGVESGG